MNHMLFLPFRVATVLLIFRMPSSYCFQFCRFHISRLIVRKHNSNNFPAVVIAVFKRTTALSSLMYTDGRGDTEGVWPLTGL